MKGRVLGWDKQACVYLIYDIGINIAKSCQFRFLKVLYDLWSRKCFTKFLLASKPCFMKRWQKSVSESMGIWERKVLKKILCSDFNWRINILNFMILCMLPKEHFVHCTNANQDLPQSGSQSLLPDQCIFTLSIFRCVQHIGCIHGKCNMRNTPRVQAPVFGSAS